MVRESQNICVSIILVFLLDWEFGTGGGGPTILLKSHQICQCLEARVFPENDSTFTFISHKMNISSPNDMPSFYTSTSINLSNGGLTLLLFHAVIGLDFLQVTWASDHRDRKVLDKK